MNLMLDFLLGLFSHDLAIDLGTANTVVFVKGRGFVQQAVKVGKKNNDYIIIEEGLAIGDQVALRDPTLPLEELGVVTSQEQGNKSNNQRNFGTLPL